MYRAYISLNVKFFTNFKAKIYMGMRKLWAGGGGQFSAPPLSQGVGGGGAEKKTTFYFLSTADTLASLWNNY